MSFRSATESESNVDNPVRIPLRKSNIGSQEQPMAIILLFIYLRLNDILHRTIPELLGMFDVTKKRWIAYLSFPHLKYVGFASSKFVLEITDSRSCFRSLD